MSTASTYWLDTNVLIEAKNTYYAFERVPKFWMFLSQQLAAGTILCPKAVYDELASGNDQLATWVKARKGRGLCVPPTREVYGHYTRISDHVMANHFRPHAEEFLTGADGWVIAYVLHFGGIAVTQESRSRKRKVRIPAVCQAFNVRCMDTFEMLGILKPTF